MFRLLFGTEEYKENALSLYNAINGTEYDDTDDLEITTIDDVIYMGIKNDSSFIIDDEINLWEHQSTYNPNMPLRGLGYFAKLYSQYVEKNNLNIYSTTKIEIPVPKYFVFYNGNTKKPEISEMRLSDLFTKDYNGGTSVEVVATMININFGNNKALMDACKALRDYSTLVDLVKKYKKTLSLQGAIDKAVKECIERDVLKDFLTRHQAEVKTMFLTEYNEAKTMNLFKAEWKAEGRAEGEKEGGNKKIYELVSNGTITPIQGANNLNVSVEELEKNMFLCGYKFPE